MIPRILPMLHDSDYRVRLRLARQIGVLFQSWDGHDEIFQDVWYVWCSIVLKALNILSNSVIEI